MVNNMFDKQCNIVDAVVLHAKNDVSNEDSIKQAVVLCILENVPVRLKFSLQDEIICFNPNDIVSFISNKK